MPPFAVICASCLPTPTCRSLQSDADITAGELHCGAGIMWRRCTRAVQAEENPHARCGSSAWRATAGCETPARHKAAVLRLRTYGTVGRCGGMSVCRCVGVSVCRYVGVSVCRSVDLSVYRSVRVLIFRTAPKHGYSSITPIHRCTGISMPAVSKLHSGQMVRLKQARDITNHSCSRGLWSLCGPSCRYIRISYICRYIYIYTIL